MTRRELARTAGAQEQSLLESIKQSYMQQLTAILNGLSTLIQNYDARITTEHIIFRDSLTKKRDEAISQLEGYLEALQKT